RQRAEGRAGRLSRPMDPNVTALAATFAGAAFLAGPLAQRYASQHRLARACSLRRTLVLTYDDGPDAVGTPEIVALLREHRGQASFFAVGRRAEGDPAVLDLVVRDGHEVGCHSYAHVHPWRTPPWTSVRDVARGLRAVGPWLSPARLYRPPHGKVTPWTW